jgi:hypothetical protein
VYVDKFHFLVNNWIHLFINKLHKPLIKQIFAQGKSESPDLFGSSVIDFLECLLDCKKDITVNIDSGGWCYIKGQYKVYRTGLYLLPFGFFGLTPLTVDKQKQLHDRLYDLASMSNNYYLWRLRRSEEFEINFNDGLSELDRALCEEECFYRALYDSLHDKNHLIFEVDLKCRKELAPVELLLELLKEESYEDNEDESAHGTHTAQDPGPDLELKFQVRKEQSLSMPPGFVSRYLIQQRHTDSNWPCCSHAFV